MKKRIGIYGIIWAICLAVFNVITFITPDEIDGVSKFGGSFWVGYIFITVAFVGQLACAAFALKENNSKKLFYRVPLSSVSYTGLILMLIIGSVCMAIPAFPEWIGIVACVIILAFNAIAVIKASVAAEIVDGIDENVKNRTAFIRNLAVDAQGLMTCAASDEIRAEVKKIYEAIRYSNPVSSHRHADINMQIERAYGAFAEAVKDADGELCRVSADSLIELLEKRNQLCK